jgi:hypothetical protein
MPRYLEFRTIASSHLNSGLKVEILCGAVVVRSRSVYECCNQNVSQWAMFVTFPVWANLDILYLQVSQGFVVESPPVGLYR